jgi:hypothetical protein
MEQLKTFLKKYKIWVIAVVVLAVVGFAAKTAIDYHNNNLVSKVEVKFSGYDGEGTAKIANHEKFIDNYSLQIFKKAGIKENVAKSILNGKTDYSQFPADLREKINFASYETQAIQTSISTSTQLKNGDKITVYVKNNDPKNLPFKNGKKVVTVKGLKKPKKISTKKILNKLSIKAFGPNGNGSLSVVTKDIDDYSTYFEDASVKVKNDGILSNGDIVKIKVPSSAFVTKSGKYQFSGSHTITYKVSGLFDPKSISNMDDAVNMMNKIRKDTGDSDHLTGLYLNNGLLPTYESTDSSSTTSDVEISTKHEDYSFSLIGFYKDDADLSLLAVNYLTVKDNKITFSKDDPYGAKSLDGLFDLDDDEISDYIERFNSDKAEQKKYDASTIKLK